MDSQPNNTSFLQVRLWQHVDSQPVLLTTSTAAIRSPTHMLSSPPWPLAPPCLSQALTQWAESNLPQYMADAQQQWQPSLLLPDLSSEAGWQQLRELREEAQKLPTDILVVLVSVLFGSNRWGC